MIIAVDSSAIARAFDGHKDRSAALFRKALLDRTARISSVVLTELMSNPGMTEGMRRIVRFLPHLEFHPGYWERAGSLRASLLARKVRAFVPDVLIAQSCIDHDIPLITYDRDFRHFERAGLKLL